MKGTDGAETPQIAARHPPPALTIEKLGEGVAEWIWNAVGRGRKVGLLVSGGDMGPKEISKLITLLQAQKAVLDDDDENDEE